MRVIKQFAIFLLIASLATSAGYLLRKSQIHSASTNIAAPQTISNTVAPKNASPKSARKETKTLLVAKFEADLARSSGVTRLLRWIEAVDQAGPADFPSLFAMAGDKQELVQLIATRWAEKDPRGFFAELFRLGKQGRYLWEAGNVLFAAWAQTDMDGMLAAVDELDNSSSMSQWHQQAVNQVFPKDPEKGLSLMSRWHIENYIPFSNNDGIAAWAAKNPQHAAEVALTNPAGAATRSVMEIVGREWAKTDPAAALAFAQSNKNQFSALMADTAFSQWSDQNLKQAADWLANASPSTRDELSGKFVQSWAKSDLVGAFQWAQANLSGPTLTHAIGSAMQAAADKDVVAAADIVQSMDPSTARAEAAASVARKWFPDSFSGKKPPDEAVQWLDELDPDSTQRAVSEVSWQWAEGDPQGMAAFLKNSTSDQIPSWVYSNVARNLARNDPAAAMDWSNSLPSRYSNDVGTQAFTEWRNSQPQAASEWLAHLPADDPRRTTFLQNAISDWATDPNKAEQLARFAAINPSAAEQMVKALPIAEDRRAAALLVVHGN